MDPMLATDLYLAAQLYRLALTQRGVIWTNKGNRALGQQLLWGASVAAEVAEYYGELVTKEAKDVRPPPWKNVTEREG
jgi:hypothetical protein